tara:strand:- start:194 stop:496 length:303 start_codon:yes stop_codon:yes gene_type:complete
MYKIGTIKVAWINPNNYDELSSTMYSSLSDAINATKDKSDFMIMKLIQNEGDSYKWEVLPYGDYKSYNYGMKISKNPLIKYTLAGLALFGAYSIFKRFKP